MSRSSFFPPVFILAAVLFALPSCRKAYNYIHDHPDAHDTLCRVDQLDFSGFVINISYNAKGNPVNMLFANPNIPASNIEQHFRYDRHDRLTDYYWNFVNNIGVLIWHKYAYPRQGIVTDTQLVYTGYVNDPVSPIATPENSRIFMYKLDAEGKMIGRTELSDDLPQPPPVFEEITYDARGNLVYPYHDIQYDDHVNVYRTNKVWQFVYQDYSRNNPYPAGSGYASVNDFGLPLTLPPVSEIYYYPFGYYLNVYGTNGAKVTYACTVPRGHGY